DALGTKLARETALLGRIRVHPHAERATRVRPRQQLDQLLLFAEVGLDRGEVAEEDLAGRSVDGDRVALVHDLVADTHLTFREVDVERRDAGDAWKAQTARDDRRVTRRPTPSGEDPGGRDHPVEVVRTRLGTHEHDQLLRSL